MPAAGTIFDWVVSIDAVKWDVEDGIAVIIADIDSAPVFV